MEEILIAHGFWALFFLSFFASTLLPLGSEWLLTALLLQGGDPGLAVSVATAGNVLGACTTYYIGVFGGPFLVEKILRIDETSKRKAFRIYEKYGVYSLLFSWVPVVGDPLCLAGGVMRVRFRLFLLLVFSGKLARYGFVAILTLWFKDVF